MRTLMKLTFIAIAFGFLATTASDAMAQNRGARREYRREVREARREYRDSVRNGDSRRKAMREYREDIRDARREYRDDRRDNRRWNNRNNNRPPYGRAWGYYNRSRHSTNNNYYRNGRNYRRY